MKIILFSFAFLFAVQISYAQNPGAISGIITDTSEEPLPGATILLKETLNLTNAGSRGEFSLQKITAGRATVVISHIGYETIELPVTISEGQTLSLNARLKVDERIGSTIVVSASKRPEKITHAPASIQVIGVKDFNQFAGSNVNELVSKIQGIEYTRNGVSEINFNARGFNSAFNNKVLYLVDNRNSMASLSAGLPIYNRGTLMKDDIEKMEIVLGPQTALYGPNAHNAVINIITKDPRKYQGTTLGVSAGSQNQFSGRIRQAMKINNKWAYKITGEFATGKEFNFYDSVYAGGGPNKVFGDTVAIPERIFDFNFRHIHGEGTVYYSVTPKTDIIVSGGSSYNDYLQVTTAGRNQMRGITYSFVQARLVHPRFFFNLYNTWGSIGTTHAIPSYTRDFYNRTHSNATTGPNRRLLPEEAEAFALRRFREKSQRINADFQHNYKFENAGLFVVAGLNYQEERPNGYGINLIDSFIDIRVSQYGAVLQLEKLLPWSIRLITTTRVDKHENFGSFFAPRFAFVKGIGDGSFRVTWGKAYVMPSIQNQYAGIGRTLFGNGGTGIYYIPSGINIKDKHLYRNTTPLKPEQIHTWEFGYKGTFAKKLFVDINYYNGRSKDFISPTRSVQGRALTVNGFEASHNPNFAGTVTNDTLKGGSFSTFFNYSEVRAYGLDLGLNYRFNKFFNASIKYSWFGSDITKSDLKNDANKDEYVSLEETSLNTPEHRGAILLNFQNLCKERLYVNLSGRFVQRYEFYSVSQIGTIAGKGSRGKVYGGINPINNQPRWYLKNFDHGPVGDFITVDLSAGYKINEIVSANIGVTNLFNTRQIEFVGSPSIKRLIMAEIKLHVPSMRKKMLANAIP